MNHPNTADATHATWSELDTESRTEAVRILASLGKTSPEMADALSTTRNAVLGVARRGNISIGGGSSRRVRALPPLPVEPPVAPDTWVPLHAPVGFLDLADDQCRWPVGEAGGSAQMFCGGQVHRKGYCQAHHGKAFGLAPEVPGVPTERSTKASVNRRDYRALVHAGKAQHFGGAE